VEVEVGEEGSGKKPGLGEDLEAVADPTTYRPSWAKRRTASITGLLAARAPALR
jgi:hypothetical protein